MNGKRVRMPFLPLTFDREYIGKPGEIMIDVDEKSIYVKDLNEIDNIKIIHIPNVMPDIQLLESTIKGNIDPSRDDLSKLKDALIPIEQWYKYLKESDTGFTDTIEQIFLSFREYKNSDPTLIELLNSKTDLDGTNKGYSDNSFTHDELNKLNNISLAANNYKHPINKVCNFIPEVISINGKFNDVVLNKTDFKGLETVDPDANYYVHPTNQICSFTFPIRSVNGQVGNVIITKDDIGLNLLNNLDYARLPEDILVLDNIEEKYITPKSLHDAIKYRIFGDAKPEDGRVAVEIKIFPEYADVLFRLRPKLPAMMTRLTDEDFVNWTYGNLFRLEPGEYEYEIAETDDWPETKGTFSAVLGKPMVLDVILDDLDIFYATILNVKGPDIERAFISEFPYTQSKMLTTENGRSTIECKPGSKYKYTLMFGIGYPQAHGEFIMPGQDALIIHKGGGTVNDEGLADEGEYDELLKPPSVTGKITITTIPYDAEFLLLGKNMREYGKVFDISYKTEYNYICSLYGYKPKEGVLYLEPWEESLNLTVELERNAQLTIRIYPSTIEDLLVEVEVLDSWHTLTKGKVFSDYTYYDNGKKDGDIRNEYVEFNISSIPEGVYNYRVKSKSDIIFSGVVDIPETGDVLKEIKANFPIVYRYYDIRPDITPKGDKYILYVINNNIKTEHRPQDAIRIYDNNSILKLNAYKPDTGEEYNFYVDLGEAANISGGIVFLPLNIKSKIFQYNRDDKIDNILISPIPTIGKIDTPNTPDIVNKSIIIKHDPSDALLTINGRKGKTIEVGNIGISKFNVSYDEICNYKLTKSGYQTLTGTIPNNKNMVGIIETLKIYKVEQCVFLINPTNMKRVRVYIKLNDIWVEVPKISEEIVSNNYNVYDDISSTQLEKSVYIVDGISNGEYEYRVDSDYMVIASGKFKYDDNKGITLNIEVGENQFRRYEISFDVKTIYGDVIDNYTVETYSEDGCWIKENGNSITVLDDKYSITYRILVKDMDPFCKTIYFKNVARFEGGKILEPVLLVKRNDYDITSTKGNSFNLPDNERYVWVSSSVNDVTVKIEGYTDKEWIAKDKYYKTTDYTYASKSIDIIEENNQKYYQGVVGFYNNGNFDQFVDKDKKYFTVIISKEGYDTIKKSFTWRDVDTSDFHIDIFLNKMSPCIFNINPIMSDNLNIELTSISSNIKYNTKLVKSKYDNNGPNNGRYTPSLKDEQFSIYTNFTENYEDVIPEGVYKYSVRSGGILYQEDIVIIDGQEYINKYINIDKEYTINFNIMDESSSAVSDFEIFIYLNNEWVSQKKSKVYKHKGKELNVKYAIMSNGKITHIDIIELHHPANVGGCIINEKVKLYSGDSIKPSSVPLSAKPYDDKNLNNIIVKIRVNTVVTGITAYEILDKLDIYSKIDSKISFIPKVGYVKEFVLEKGLKYNLALDISDKYEKLYYEIDTSNLNKNEYLQQIFHDIYDNIYSVESALLTRYIINIVPSTIDNLKVQLENSSGEIFDISKIGEVISDEKQYQIYQSNLIKADMYDIKVIKNGYSIPAEIKNKLTDSNLSTDIIINSHLDRFYEYRIKIKHQDTPLDATVKLYYTNQSGLSLWVNMNKSIDILGEIIYVYKVYGNVKNSKIRIEKDGYKSTESNIIHDTTPIKGGKVISKLYHIDKFIKSTIYKFSIYPKYNSDFECNSLLVLDNGNKTIIDNNMIARGHYPYPIPKSISLIKNKDVREIETIENVYWIKEIYNNTKVRTGVAEFSIGHFAIFTIDNKNIKPGDIVELTETKTYVIDILFIIHNDIRNSKIVWDHKINSFRDENYKDETALRLVDCFKLSSPINLKIDEFTNKEIVNKLYPKLIKSTIEINKTNKI